MFFGGREKKLGEAVVGKIELLFSISRYVVLWTSDVFNPWLIMSYTNFNRFMQRPLMSILPVLSFFELIIHSRVEFNDECCVITRFTL